MGTQIQSHQSQEGLPNGTLKLVLLLTQRQRDTERDAGKLYRSDRFDTLVLTAPFGGCEWGPGIEGICPEETVHDNDEFSRILARLEKDDHCV